MMIDLNTLCGHAQNCISHTFNLAASGYTKAIAPPLDSSALTSIAKTVPSTGTTTTTLIYTNNNNRNLKLPQS